MAGPLGDAALIGVARTEQDEQVAAYLGDASALVRAVARDAARRTGIDALSHYRDAVGQPDPAVGAIAGLAEVGSSSDAAAMAHLLAHPQARVRAQAVCGLRQLGAVPVEEMIVLLRDSSPAVVREATAALRPLNRAVPASLPWQLLADQRLELRRSRLPPSMWTAHSSPTAGSVGLGLRYRPAARRPQMIDTGMSHLGFRTVAREAEPTRGGDR